MSNARYVNTINLSRVCASVPSGQHPVRLQSAIFNYRNAHYKNSENKTYFSIGLKINFLLNQPQCHIHKMLRNRDKINPLPLMIFIWWQSEDIHLLNKCSFCSMKSLYIQKPQAQTQSKQSDKKKTKLYP